MTVAAEAIIIKNLQVLEDVAVAHDKNVGPNVADAINALVTDFAKANELECECDLWKSEKVVFGSPHWCPLHEVEWKAHYDISFVVGGKVVDPDDIPEHFWMSPLIGVGVTRAGFRFGANFKLLGLQTQGVWKNKVQNHATYNTLRQNGFVLLNNGDWFLPWQISATDLADAYVKETIREALDPVATALMKVKDHQNLFDQLLLL